MKTKTGTRRGTPEMSTDRATAGAERGTSVRKKHRAPSKRGPDIRDVKATVVLLDATLTINGGMVTQPDILRVWQAVKSAFEGGAHAHGLGCSWVVGLKSVNHKVMDAKIAREGLYVELPRAAPAVREDVEEPIVPLRDRESSSS